MKSVKYTIIILIALLIAVPALLTFLITYIPSLPQPSLGATQKIDEWENLSQSFTEKNNNLAEVALTLKNPDFKNKQDIIFNLYDSTGHLLRTTTRNGSSIIDGDFVKFQFAPIADSANQSYTFTLSAPRVNINDALESYISPQNTPGGVMKVNDKVATGSASFATFYRIPNRFFVLKSVLQGVVQKLLADSTFAIIYILLILSCAGYLLKDLLKNRRR